MSPSNKKYTIILKPLVDVWAHQYPERVEEAGTDARKRQKRIIYADAVKVLDNGTMLAGIDPGNRATKSSCITSRGGHRKYLDDHRNNPEFYTITHAKPDSPDNSHTDYIITRHFKKILSINLDNVLSINGKPVMGRVDKTSLDSALEE